MKLIHKLTFSFLFVALLISITGYLAIGFSRKALEEAYINNTAELALNIMDKIDRDIHGKLEIFLAYSHDLILRETLSESNRAFGRMPDVTGYIEQKDRQWISRDKEVMPFIDSLLESELSHEMSAKVKYFTGKHDYNMFPGITVTNKYGAVTAMTSITDDYRQDDEVWWRAARRDGMFTQDVRYDETADVYSVELALRIDDEKGNFMGVMNVLLNIKEIKNIIESLRQDKAGTAMDVKLVTSDRRLIYSSKDEPLSNVSYLLRHAHPHDSEAESAGNYNIEGDILYVDAHSRGYQDFKGFGWILLIGREAEDVFAPVAELKRKIAVVSISVTLIAAGIGLLVSLTITGSIGKLTAAARRIGRGELHTRIGIRSRDEIGQLAKTFEQMAEDLKKVTVRRDELLREVEEREKAEKGLREAEAEWEGTFNTIPDMITVHDQNFNIIRANTAAKKGLNLPETNEKGELKCYEYFHGSSSPPEYCQSCQSLITREPYTFKTFEPQLDKYIEIRAVPRFNGSDDRDFSGVIHIVRDITEQEEAEDRIKNQLKKLHALNSVEKAITSSFDLKVTFDILLDQIISELDIDAAALLLLDRKTGVLEYTAGRGFRSDTLKYTKLRLGEGNAGRAAVERRIMSILDLDKDINGFVNSSSFPGEEFVAYFAVPLIAKGEVKGVMELFHRDHIQSEPEWLGFLETMANQAASAIDNVTLFNDLQRSNIELRLAYDRTIEGWARALEMRDRETEGHSQRVADMTVRIAREMGIAHEELPHIKRGALLHDIGKMGIPDSILLNKGSLTWEEWEIMKRHPVNAYELLYPIEYLNRAVDIPYCHHEKWDGSGYPRGLTGKDIPFAARIFAVVDVWDALSSERPYRPAWPKEKILEHLRSQRGKHFDPEVVDFFLEQL